MNEYVVIGIYGLLLFLLQQIFALRRDAKLLPEIEAAKAVKSCSQLRTEIVNNQIKNVETRMDTIESSVKELKEIVTNLDARTTENLNQVNKNIEHLHALLTDLANTIIKQGNNND